MSQQRTTQIAAFLMLAVMCSGCSMRQQSSDPSARDFISGEDLRRGNNGNVYEALERLRPEWLRSRGPTSVTDPTPTRANVYMNGSQVGNLEYLRQVSVVDVGEIRYYAPGEAGVRFGMGNPMGVIDITPR
jgi:hypothetical protein